MFPQLHSTAHSPPQQKGCLTGSKPLDAMDWLYNPRTNLWCQVGPVGTLPATSHAQTTAAPEASQQQPATLPFPNSIPPLGGQPLLNPNQTGFSTFAPMFGPPPIQPAQFPLAMTPTASTVPFPQMAAPPAPTSSMAKPKKASQEGPVQEGQEASKEEAS